MPLFSRRLDGLDGKVEAHGILKRFSTSYHKVFSSVEFSFIVMVKRLQDTKKIKKNKKQSSWLNLTFDVVQVQRPIWKLNSAIEF